jgi:hypothetical protein
MSSGHPFDPGAGLDSSGLPFFLRYLRYESRERMQRFFFRILHDIEAVWIRIPSPIQFEPVQCYLLQPAIAQLLTVSTVTKSVLDGRVPTLYV